MARYLQFRLPPLKVTQRSAGGSCLKKDVQRGASLGDIHPCSQQDVTETESVDYNLALGFEGDYKPPEGPNLYEIQQQANAAAWERIRRMMLNPVVESNAMPLGQACVKCLQTSASLQCQKCGPAIFYCDDCFLADHSKFNFFHVAEEWKVKCTIDIRCVPCLISIYERAYFCWYMSLTLANKPLLC